MRQRYYLRHMEFKPGRRNLIAVLDWGLGHASRSLALAARLEAGGEKIAFASAGLALKMLRRERPDLMCHPLPAYRIGYQSSNMVLNIGRQLPRIIRVVWREQRVLREILRSNDYQRVISDNRFGCYARERDSVFLTHQLKPIFGLPLAGGIYRRFLTHRFTAFWVPDWPGTKGMSGKLSDPTGYKNVSYLGPLSRLQRPGQSNPDHVYDLVALLSGPEPQRTYLEKIMLKTLQSGGGRYLIIAGRPGGFDEQATVTAMDGGSIHRLSFSNAAQTAAYLGAASTIICRSGYSTLMDLVQLEVTARLILVPTPGQTEQEYLACRWAKESDSSSAPGKVMSVAQTELATLLAKIL